MMFANERTTACVVLAMGCVLVAGCGGGGGGGNGGSTPPQNRAPIFGTVQFSTNEDTDLSAQVTGSDADGDALTFTKTGDPGKGTVTAFAADGSFTYRPNPDAFGSDSFAVRVQDSQGTGVNGTVTVEIAAVADAPQARNDTLSASGAGLANLDVLANDTDADGDALTVTLESPAEVGTASVNAGGSIAISALPAGFRGVTRFRYKVTDPGGASSVGTAAVFVDVDAFPAIFVGDEPGNDSNEVYITDLASPPVKLTTATEGDQRLRSFVASANGSTVVYRRRDQSQPTDLAFVRTADPATRVPIQLPNGMELRHDTVGNFDYYVVSPDGQWIAAVAWHGTPASVEVILLNIADPTVIHTASPADVIAAQMLQFSSDSQHLYFLASVEGGVSTGFSLFRAALTTPDQSTQLSAPAATATDGVAVYSVLEDQPRVVLAARRNDVRNLYYVNPALPGTETRINHQLDPDDEIVSSVVQLRSPPGGSLDARLAYSVRPQGILQAASYVAEISSSPLPRRVGPDGYVVENIRPDGAAVLLSGVTGLVESLVDSGDPPLLVTDSLDAFNARYDARGDAILAQVAHEDPPGNEYLTVGATVRPAFGSTQHVGSPDMSVRFTNFIATDRAIAFIGEGPLDQTQPFHSVRIALANAWAPDKLLYLADFVSTTQTIRGGRVQVVDP
jgi:hypothetical protein